MWRADNLEKHSFRSSQSIQGKVLILVVPCHCVGSKETSYSYRKSVHYELCVLIFEHIQNKTKKFKHCLEEKCDNVTSPRAYFHENLVA